MSGKVYENHFTPEQLQNMKASTLQNLKKKEESLAFAVIALFAVGFIEAVVLVATLLWTNKFTLFLFLVGILFILVSGYIYRTLLKDYKKTLEDVKGEYAK